MKTRWYLSAIAGVVASSGLALADPLAEVSADPRDGNDTIGMHHTTACELELVGMNDVVDLHALTIRFDNGLVVREGRRHWIRPGESLIIDLPRGAGSIASLELDYGRPELRRRDRTDARVQIFAVDHGHGTGAGQPVVGGDGYDSLQFATPARSFEARNEMFALPRHPRSMP